MVTDIPLSARIFLVSICLVMIIPGPAAAFTANSLEITVDKNGDAIAIFSFSLEGFLENAIPQSVLEEQLLKGLSTSSDPPELIAMDRSSATIRMKKFADVSGVPTGTEYRTASMNFKKAEIALQESALSSVVTADFSPSSMKVTFPDRYERTFASSDILPAITHVVIDPAKAAAAMQTPIPGGSAKIISSPEGVQVSIDGSVIGTAPDTFTGIPEGSHKFEFAKENYAPVSRTVTIKEGQTVQVSVFLAPIESTPAKQAPGFSLVLAGFAVLVSLEFFLRR